MKILDLATELKLSGDEVLEKAKAMGISVSDVSDEVSDIDATAVRNTILRGNAKAETKVARRSKSKKAEADKKDGEPKVTTKAANVKLPEINRFPDFPKIEKYSQETIDYLLLKLQQKKEEYGYDEKPCRKLVHLPKR